jgi:hypothetical protein
MTPGRITSSFITAALGAAVACMLGLVCGHFPPWHRAAGR